MTKRRSTRRARQLELMEPEWTVSPPEPLVRMLDDKFWIKVEVPDKKLKHVILAWLRGQND